MVKELIVAGVLTFVAMRIVWRTMTRGSWSGSLSPWLRVVLFGSTVGVLGSAAWLRCAGTDRLLWGHDEIVNLLAGIRLHLLPWFNLGDPVERNFFKSLALPVHGLGDTAFFYVVVAVFRLLHIPLSASHLFLAGAGLSMASLVLLFCVVQWLCGPSVGFLVMALAAWHPLLVACSKMGFQLNVVLFLQVAVLAGYALHVSANRWWASMLATVLMVFCAGSELFYLAPVLVMLQAALLRFQRLNPQTTAGRSAAGVGWFDQKNLMVWGGFGLMMLVGLGLFFAVGSRLDLTLLGHVFRKRQHEGMAHPVYGVGQFVDGFNGLVEGIPHFAYVVLGAMVLALWREASSRRPLTLFFAAYLVLMGSFIYLMKLSHGFNTVHLLLPALVVVAIAWVCLFRDLASLLRRPRAFLEPLAGVIGVAILLCTMKPWSVQAAPGVPEAYRGIKAAAYAIREMGVSSKRVMVLSNHPFIPSTMEYYLGVAASSRHGASTRLFYIREVDARYLPSRLAERLGLPTFDYYIEFVKEEFPGKAQFLADLERQDLRLVAEVVGQDGVGVRIYSPQALPLRRVSVEEGNRGFDQKYARWERLFSDAHAGVFFYFGADY